MTANEKIELINKMIADVMEFTDYDKGALDALVCCISAVTEYGQDEENT